MNAMKLAPVWRPQSGRHVGRPGPATAAACASAAEVSAIQVASVQQELTDAALACGPKAVALFNHFQTLFNKELRRSDATMLKMFKRLNGNRAGDNAYDAFKTRAIAHAEQRRTKPGAHENFCRTADVVFAAALAPDKPVLEDFVSGVPVNEATPVDSCEIKVAVALQGVQAGLTLRRRPARICPVMASRFAAVPKVACVDPASGAKPRVWRRSVAPSLERRLAHVAWRAASATSPSRRCPANAGREPRCSSCLPQSIRRLGSKRKRPVLRPALSTFRFGLISHRDR